MCWKRNGDVVTSKSSESTFLHNIYGDEERDKRDGERGERGGGVERSMRGGGSERGSSDNAGRMDGGGS